MGRGRGVAIVAACTAAHQNRVILVVILMTLAAVATMPMAGGVVIIIVVLRPNPTPQCIATQCITLFPPRAARNPCNSSHGIAHLTRITRFLASARNSPNHHRRIGSLRIYGSPFLSLGLSRAPPLLPVPFPMTAFLVALLVPFLLPPPPARSRADVVVRVTTTTRRTGAISETTTTTKGGEGRQVRRSSTKSKSVGPAPTSTALVAVGSLITTTSEMTVNARAAARGRGTGPSPGRRIVSAGIRRGGTRRPVAAMQAANTELARGQVDTPAKGNTSGHDDDAIMCALVSALQSNA